MNIAFGHFQLRRTTVLHGKLSRHVLPSEVRQFPLTFLGKITIPPKLFDSRDQGSYALPTEKQAVNLFSPIRRICELKQGGVAQLVRAAES